MISHSYNRFLPTFVALAVMTVTTLPASAQSYDIDKAYLIIKATAADETAKQPKWIGIGRQYTRTIHVSAEDLIVGINPGKYQITHFDFENDPLGRDTVFMRKGGRFQVKAGRVYIIGHYSLNRLRRNRHEIKVEADENLLVSACEKAPEFFKHFPLAGFDTDEVAMVQCAEFLKTDQSN